MTDRITELIAAKQGIWLDVGCGPHKDPRAIGMDKRALPGVDLVHDIEVLPWPLPDACCYRILMSHIVEHLKPWLVLDVIAECHRVMKDLGQLLIVTPYGGSPRFWQDPSHTHGWVEPTPQYWDCAYPLWRVYEPPCWQIEMNLFQSDGDLQVILAKRPGLHQTHGQPPKD